MKRLALIGLSGVELTTHYARSIAAEIEHRYSGKLHPDFITLTLQPASRGSWTAGRTTSETTEFLDEALASVARLGAKACVICSRESYDPVGTRLGIQAVSIFEPVAATLRRARLRRIGLLGARAPLEEKHWQGYLGRAGICDALLPVPRDRDYLAGLCEREFSQGLVTVAARADVVRIAHSLRQAGARAAVVLAPELTAVLEDSVPVLPILDATELHAFAAVDWILGGEETAKLEVLKRESVAKTTRDGSADP